MYYEDDYGCAEAMPCKYDPSITCFDSDCKGCPVIADGNGEDPDSEEWLPYDPYSWMY